MQGSGHDNCVTDCMFKEEELQDEPTRLIINAHHGSSVTCSYGADSLLTWTVSASQKIMLSKSNPVQKRQGQIRRAQLVCDLLMSLALIHSCEPGCDVQDPLTFARWSRQSLAACTTRTQIDCAAVSLC